MTFEFLLFASICVYLRLFASIRTIYPAARLRPILTITLFAFVVKIACIEPKLQPLVARFVNLVWLQKYAMFLTSNNKK